MTTDHERAVAAILAHPEPHHGTEPRPIHLDADDDDPAPTWPLIVLGVVAFIASGIFFLASLPVLR